jgi:N6-L-threonylcarbamoyladenine synthase
VHEQYGGVVPELASRAHQHHILPVVDAALKKAGVSKEQLHAIACTQGPGLLGSLLVGMSFSKAMAAALGLPLITVNHLDAHIQAHFIVDEPAPELPFICLTVSGGHTQLAVVHDPSRISLIGKTLDDAAGEAFDKTAKLLGLPYPGGPRLDEYASAGDASRFPFPVPEIPELDFSFSGLKTSVLYFLRKQLQQDPDFIEKHRADLCSGIQQSIINQLMHKLRKAVKESGIRTVAVSGGVSANSGLRQSLMEEGRKNGWEVHIPKLEYCTDNAAMIAIAAHFKYLRSDFSNQAAVPFARQPYAG